MFAIAPTDRMECIHPYDAALALANACSSEGVWGKTLLISGGPRCQMTMADYYRGYLDAMGVGPLDARYFATDSYHLDWYDTTESEALLHYQRHSYADFVRELRRRQRLTRAVVTCARPLVAARAAALRGKPLTPNDKQGQLWRTEKLPARNREPQRSPLVSRHAAGGWPTCRLKARLKAASDSYPTRTATSANRVCDCFNRYFASWMRHVAKYCIGDSPINAVKR